MCSVYISYIKYSSKNITEWAGDKEWVEISMSVPLVFVLNFRLAEQNEYHCKAKKKLKCKMILNCDNSISLETT